MIRRCLNGETHMSKPHVSYSQYIKMCIRDSSMGVRGMNIDDGDEVVAMQLNSQGDCLLIVSANGMGKRTSMGEFCLLYTSE